LIGALISPSTSDGRTWDGPDLTTTQINDLATLASLLSGQSPYVDIAAFVVNLGIMAYAPPDPFGVAELAWNGPFDPARNLELANTSTNTEDTFNPQWPGPPFPGWINVPSGPTLRVRVTLQDEDLVFDDMIGTAELSAEDLRAAFNSGGIANIAVYDQGVHQILYLSVSVTASAPPQVCNGECTANLYSACTCAAGDPCGWLGDGVCDSFCTANFPSNHLDDFTDCAAACASDCQNLLYSACTCASVDPCNWQNDGVCDDTCAQSFPADHFDDPLDCP
jgi:hypothetical protein